MTIVKNKCGGMAEEKQPITYIVCLISDSSQVLVWQKVIWHNSGVSFNFSMQKKFHSKRCTEKVIPLIIMFHSINGEYWRYGSIGKTFLLITHNHDNFSLQQIAVERQSGKNGVWHESKGVTQNSS